MSKESGNVSSNIKIIKLSSSDNIYVENAKINSNSDVLCDKTHHPRAELELVPSVAKLMSCYMDKYMPPKWIGYVDFQQIIWRYKSQTKVYYPDGANLLEVKELATRREPTNLGGNKLYNREQLLVNYGYTENPYKIGSPNIAIFCRTPVITCRVIKPSNIKYVNILSAIAPALDTLDQPDYRYLEKENSYSKRNYKYACMLATAFKHIRCCFIEGGYKRLIMTGLGMGNFKFYAEDLGINAEHIYRECLFRGLGDLFKSGPCEMWLNYTHTVVLHGHIPVENRKQIILKALDIQTLLDNLSQRELDDSLIINAWDPFSIVGNGNANDSSLDGYIGRISAVSILCWPLTNPDIQWKSV